MALICRDALDAKDYDVDSIGRSGRTVEIEATDSTTGESTTLEMDED